MGQDSCDSVYIALLDVALLHVRIDDDGRRCLWLDARSLDLCAARSLVRALLRSDLGERRLVNPAVRRGVTGGGKRIVGEEQRRAGGAHTSRESADRRKTFRMR